MISARTYIRGLIDCVTAIGEKNSDLAPFFAGAYRAVLLEVDYIVMGGPKMYLWKGSSTPSAAGQFAVVARGDSALDIASRAITRKSAAEKLFTGSSIEKFADQHRLYLEKCPGEINLESLKKHGSPDEIIDEDVRKLILAELEQTEADLESAHAEAQKV